MPACFSAWLVRWGAGEIDVRASLRPSAAPWSRQIWLEMAPAFEFWLSECALKKRCSQGSGRRRASRCAIRYVFFDTFPPLFIKGVQEGAPLTSQGASIEGLPETTSKEIARPCKHVPGEGWLQKCCFFDTFPPWRGAWHPASAEVSKTRYMCPIPGGKWRTSRAAARFFMHNGRWLGPSVGSPPPPFGAIWRDLALSGLLLFLECQSRFCRNPRFPSRILRFSRWC